MKRNRLYLLALVCAVSATSVGVAMKSGVLALAKSWKGPATKFQATARSRLPNHILVSRLSPQLRIPFAALGNRLVKSGMERLTLSGTLDRGGTSLLVVVVNEFPGLLRVTSTQGPVVSLNARMAGDIQTDDQASRDLVETLLYDSVENFFIAQWQGAASRLLGSGATASRVGGSGGPLYDVYEVTPGNESDQPGPPRVKRYFFNSDTQLLELVRYEVVKDGRTISVETRFTSWHSVQGQQVPGVVTRSENGSVVLSFTSTSVTLTPRNVFEAGTLPPNSSD